MAKPAPANPQPIDAREYCAVTKSRGGRHYPDFYNSPATKMIQRGDAEEAGFTMYFDGSACRCGHCAARFVANSQCVDCHRNKKGLPPIYATSKDRTYYKPPTPKSTATAAGAPVVIAAAASTEVTGQDKRTLEAIGEYGSLALAAQALKTTVGKIQARRAANPTFATALQALEDRLGIKRTLPPPTDFAWTDEIEKQFIRTWIDTGDIQTARDSCSMTASQYFQHIDESPNFSAMVDRAAPRAAKALRERAAQLALAGNTTMLKEFLPPAEAEPPKDMPSDAEMVDEIIRTLSQVKNRRLQTFLVTEFAPPEPAPADPLPDLDPDPVPDTDDDDDLDDLI